MDVTLVENVAKEFVSQQKPFTSVNLTNHIKKEKKVWVKNSEVADWLRHNFLISVNDGNFDTTTIGVNDDTDQATLYHPCFMNISSYTDTNLQAITPDEFRQLHGIDPFTGQPVKSGIISVSIPATTVTVKTTIEPTIIREIKRIHVPTRMIAAIGLQPGDSVKPDRFITTVTVPANLKVHTDGRLSIPRTCIKFNGKSIGTRPVKVFVRDNRIGFESVK